MQLTKDDLEWMNGVWFIPKSVFQQVVEFYEKYHIEFPVTGDTPYKLERYHPEIWKLFWESQKKKYPYVEQWHLDGKFSGETKVQFNKWLFSYCFKDGLK